MSETHKQKKSIDHKNHLDKDIIIYSRYYLPFVLSLTVVVFANSLGNNFASWDDTVNILDNQVIKNLNWDSLQEIFLNFHGTDFPLTIFSYSLEFKFFGVNPFYFHLINYILHIINTLLVYLLIKRITGQPITALITSLFFGIHPMHVESVAWISEMKDVLYSFFFLLSLNSYSKYLLSKRKAFCLIWSFLWFLCSIMSKPAAACLPLVLILLDYYIDKKITRNSLLLKIPFFALVLLVAIITIYLQKTFDSIPILSLAYSVIDRFFLVNYSIIYYLMKAIFPFHLCAIHFYPVKTENLLPVEYYLALPLLFLLIWAIYKSKFLKREIIFGMVFYFITIVMVLQIIPTGQQAIVAERYSYMPYIGVFFILGQFCTYKFHEYKLNNKKVKFQFVYLLIFFTILFCYLTNERNKIWKNGIVLFTDVINKYPDQGYSWFGRGFSKYEYGDNEGALSDLSKAIELNPNDAEFYFNRGNVYNITERFELAVVDYSSALKLKSDYPEAYNNRGASYGNINKLNESLDDYNKAISLNPKYAEAYFGRGLTRFSLYDKDGACNDWLFAKKLGYKDETGMLEINCK